MSIFLTKKGISSKRIEGHFKCDKPDLAITAFTDEELEEMESKGLNVKNKSDRLKFTEEKGILDELCLIPHYWIKTEKYGIIDPTIKQFEKFLTKPITDKNYIIKKESINSLNF